MERDVQNVILNKAEYEKKYHKKHFWITALVALLASLALSLTAYVALGGFSATIANNGNSFSSGTLLLEEVSNGGTPCLSSPNTIGGITTNINSACAANNFGVASSPGQSPSNITSNTIVLTNTGSLSAATLSLTPSTTCTVTGNPVGTGANSASTGSDTLNFCSKVDIQIEQDTGGAPSCLYGGTIGAACPAAMSNTYNLATLDANGPISLATNVAPSATQTIIINVELDPTATNADQGLTVFEPIV